MNESHKNVLVSTQITIKHKKVLISPTLFANLLRSFVPRYSLSLSHFAILYNDVFVHNVTDRIELSSEKSQKNASNGRGSGSITGEWRDHQSHSDNNNTEPLKRSNKCFQNDTRIDSTENSN